MKEIVIGTIYSDITETEDGLADIDGEIVATGGKSSSSQTVYIQVTTGSPASREECIKAAYRNGANSVHVYPRTMIDHMTGHVSEKGSQTTMSLKEVKAKLGIFEFSFEEIGVDAGMILIADPAHLPAYYLGKGDATHIQPVENGNYEATWSMPKSWLEENEKPTTQMLTVISGEIWVTDPCFVVQDSKWEKYLDEFDYGKKMPEGVICINTGGDGRFPVNLKLVKQESF